MPSASKKQHNFFAAIAHSPSFAKKVGVPQSVGKDFNEADKGRKFSKGDTMATGDMKENKRTLNDAMAGMYPEKEAKNKEDDADLEKNFSNAKNSLAKKDYSEAAISGAKGVGSGFRGMGRRLSMIPGAALDEARVGAIKGIKKMVGREVSDTGYKKGGFVPPFAKKRGSDMDAKKSNPFMEMIAKKKEMAAGKKSEMPMKKMAAGGVTRADGVATKGHTKGKQIVMKKGGKC